MLLFAQSCPVPCNPMDCSLPGASVHGIFQVRILEWVAISFSRGSSWSGIEPMSSALQACSLLLGHRGSPYSPPYFPAIVCNSSSPTLSALLYSLLSSHTGPLATSQRLSGCLPFKALVFAPPSAWKDPLASLTVHPLVPFRSLQMSPSQGSIPWPLYKSSVPPTPLPIPFSLFHLHYFHPLPFDMLFILLANLYFMYASH